MRAPPHLAHETLLLHLAAELPESLLELLGVLDYDSHNPTRIRGRRRTMSYSSTSGRTARMTAMVAKPSAKIPITARLWVASTGASGVANAARV